MQITFLGTAAAPSMPVLFCACQVCSVARRIGGKNLRRRSSLMINDDLLIDIGPDIATASFEHGLPLTDISVCLQTHPHEDHLDTGFILSRHAKYGTLVSGDLLLVGSGETLSEVDEIVRRTSEYGSIFAPETRSALRLNPRTIAPFEACTAGNYRVTGYPASHAQRFRKSGLLKDPGTVYATHLSHEGNLEHDELDEYAREHGYRVAFDGLKLGFEGRKHFGDRNAPSPHGAPKA